ncbi:hydroxyisourate hydrolase [Lichenicoccus sp.]|uniref:hydroxyisourate hydrolase n=1 Tax=Lichenicoccus sp. TaxID=2781899 RepID=UPI003D152966
MGRLTTHVLDTAHGCPAAGIPIRLGIGGTDMRLLRETVTNADGRCDQALLEGEDFLAGLYELTFRIADYFASRAASLSNPPFFDEIVLRFCVADPRAHYHVPLLVSPWSYSTYRGS